MNQTEFSGIALDQPHDHNNAIVKADGGAIGITENPSALLRWITSGPQICQLIKDFDSTTMSSSSVKNKHHHDDIPSLHKLFLKNVCQLTETIDYLENPITVDSAELVSLNSKHVSDSQTLYEFERRGSKQYEAFRNCREKFYTPIKKNNFQIFESSSRKHKSKSPTKKLKQNCALFSNLFIVCQTRDLDLDTFFKYENRPFHLQ